MMVDGDVVARISVLPGAGLRLWFDALEPARRVRDWRRQTPPIVRLAGLDASHADSVTRARVHTPLAAV
jgi:hypothetical protein